MSYINYYSIPGLKIKPLLRKRDPNFIIKAVCDHVEQPVDIVLGKSLSQTFTLPRHAISYFLFYFAGMNKSEIGRKLKKDHTTIINSIRVFQNRLDTEDLIKKLFADLKEKILFT